MKKNIEMIDGSYYFEGRRISRKLYHRMRYGNWADLPSEQIHSKLDYKAKRKQMIDGHELIYEELLKTPLGQYSLGVAQEKTANKIIKLAIKMKNEGRRLVRKNKNKALAKGGDM